MAKRRNGEGTWGVKTIKGTEYKFYRDINGKYFYGKTEKEIKQKRKEYKEKRRLQTVDNSMLFGDYVMSYLHNNMRMQLEATTFDANEDCVNNMLQKYTLGNVAVSAVTEESMKTYLVELAAKYSRASIDKVFKVIRPALEYAVKNNHLTQNPLEYIKLPSETNVTVKKKDIPFIIKEDLDKLYMESKRINVKGFNWGGKIGEPTYGNNAHAIVLIGHTGLRISELIGLRWKDVDICNKKIYVRNAVVRVKNRDEKIAKKYTTKQKPPKSQAGVRVIPLSEIALEMIDIFNQQYPNHTPDDFVVLNQNGKSPIPRNIQKTLDSMLIRGNCSVEHCGLHGLRHGFGAILLTNGVDIKIVSKLLGHKSVSTTYDIYIDFTTEQVQNAVITVLNKEEGH